MSQNKPNQSGTALADVIGRRLRRKPRMRWWLVIAVPALIAGCADLPPAKVYGEALTDCATNEMLVCDHASRIRNSSKLCSCQPAEQTLNSTINQ